MITPEHLTPADYQRVEATRVQPDPPSDLVPFWQEVVAELNATPLDLELRPEAGEWYATSLGGRRIGGTYSAPPGAENLPQWIKGHGYGSPEGSSRFEEPGFITLTVDARGYGRSKAPGDPGIPGWVISGIEDRRAYILRGAVADWIRAAQVARALPGANPRSTLLTGGSLGGGLAMLAAPWVPDLLGLIASVPTFGAYDLRTRLVKRGSGAEVNARLEKETDRSIIRENLRYFDVVNIAPLIQVPSLVGLGVLDDVVPGETVAAIYHALGSERKELFSYPCSHSTHPLDQRWAEFYAYSRTWATNLLRERER